MNLPLSIKPVKHLVFCKSLTNVDIGIDGNKLTQVWNIACYFYLCLRRCSVNSLLFKIFLGMLYKNRIKEQAFECYLYQLYFNNLMTGYYILSVKISTKYNKKYFLVFIKFCLYILPITYGALKSTYFPHANTQMSCNN